MLRGVIFVLTVGLAASVSAEPPFPSVEVVPLPNHQIAFEIDGQEVLRYHGDHSVPRPFIYPLIGPAGKRLTTMAHPEDPYGHRHHRSVWIAHRDVNGHNFWEDKGAGRIVMTKLEAYGHGTDTAWFRAAHAWRDPAGMVLMDEQRTWAVTKGDKGAYYLDLTMVFRPGEGGAVTFGKTPFGLLAVRVNPTVSVKFGGGRILNSEGARNEAGVHWKTARWVDYAGPVAPNVVNGVALFDHPKNPGSPTGYHVRDEGWMGCSFTFAAPYVLKEGESLELRYRLFVHGPDAAQADLEAQWKGFAEK